MWPATAVWGAGSAFTPPQHKEANKAAGLGGCTFASCRLSNSARLQMWTAHADA